MAVTVTPTEFRDQARHGQDSSRTVRAQLKIPAGAYTRGQAVTASQFGLGRLNTVTADDSRGYRFVFDQPDGDGTRRTLHVMSGDTEVADGTVLPRLTTLATGYGV
jgi:hypothetical protein